LRGEAEGLRLRWLADVDPPTSQELVEAWRASVAGFEEMGHAFETARSQARLAAALHAAGEATEARRLVTAARESRRRLGAEALVAELRTVAGGSTAGRGAPRPPRGRARAGGSQPATAAADARRGAVD